MVANWCYRCTGTAASGTQSPTTSLPPGEGPTAQCLNIRAFDTSWNVLSSTQLSALEAGNIVRFTVAGTATSGSFDKAKFKINGQETGEITTLKPDETAMYYYEYVIPEGVTAFTVGAKVHHSTLGWSN